MTGEQNWDRARWLWLAALVAGASYYGAVLQGWHGPAITIWKTAGVGLLALWAMANARSGFGWMVAAVLGFGALGDALIESWGLLAGAAAFSVGHVIAIILYIQNRRTFLSRSQKLLASLLLPLTLIISWGLTQSAGSGDVMAAILYAGLVAVMAACAWVSRFPRYRTGIGAILFLVSDMLIFARAGGAMSGVFVTWLIWPLYFAGQAMIAWGVVRTVANDGFANKG
jgi:uncharacterized membrane protein YhhN